ERALLAGVGEEEAGAGGNQVAVGQAALALYDQRFLLRELSAGDVNILLARADFDQALRLLRRLELRLRHAQGGLAQVVILPGNASRANQLLGAGPVCFGTGQRRLPVGSLGPGLGDFLRPRAMLQSR